MERKRLAILANLSKPGTEELLGELRPWFEPRVDVVAVFNIGEALPPAARSADLCVVFGGDGTLLTAARLFADLAVPLVGVNIGKLGFLAEFNLEHMQKHLGDILAGRIIPTERLMLQMCLFHQGSRSCTSAIANDLAISAGPPFRMIDLDVSQDDNHVCRYVGDGLIVSTPTGSTGYNMSVGGPIMVPTLRAIAITPIAPHSLSVRPIVVGSEGVIHVTANKVNPGTAVIIDGQVSYSLDAEDVVEIRRAPRNCLIIPHPGWGFFRTLAGKLKWGHSPHHGS